MADQKKMMNVIPRLNIAGEKGGPEGDGITPDDVDIQTKAGGEANPAESRDPATFKGSNELDLTAGDAEEVEIAFEAAEKSAVVSALRTLSGKGANAVVVAAGKAKFFRLEDPEKVDFSAVKRQVAQSYKHPLSDNDAFFFNVDVPESLRVASSKDGAKVELSLNQLGGIIRNAAEIGARNAMSAMMKVLSKNGLLREKRAGIEEGFGKDGKTDVQKAIETSKDPSRAMVDAIELDFIDPEGQLKALDEVSKLPLDFTDAEPVVARGRKADRIPAKVASRNKR